MHFFLVDRGNRLSTTLRSVALLLSQFTRVTTCQLDVSVQDIKDALSHDIHVILVTVKDYGLTHFRFGHLEYVKSVIIRFHSLQHLSASRRWSVLSGIYRFQNAGDHRYPVTDLEVDTRGVVESRPGRPCRD